MISLSVSPTLAGHSLSPRAHRSAAVSPLPGRKTWVLPGGLDARGVARGFARGQFLAGRRVERYLGSGIGHAVPVTVAVPIRWRFAVTIAGSPDLRARCTDAAPGMIMRHSALLSRYAENLFWLARYMERVENLARVSSMSPTPSSATARTSRAGNPSCASMPTMKRSSRSTARPTRKPCSIST